MTLPRILLKGTDDLYVPNFERNIYKVLPTALRCMGVKVPRDDLFNYSEIQKHLKVNDAKEAKRVIVCIVDSMGLDNIRNTAFAKLFDNLGGVALSSTFPTITSAAITSIHMGVPPSEHGIFGHRIYFPEYGSIVDTLRMTGQNSRIRDAIPISGIDVRTLLWSSPISDLLKQTKYQVIHADGLPGQIAGTGLGHLFTNKSNILPFSGYVDAFGMTRRVLSAFSGKPLFVSLYFGNIDLLAHKYGPYSLEFREGCNSFLHHLQAFVESLSPAEVKHTTIVICSDHGQNPFRNERRIFFSQEQLEKVKGTLSRPPGHSGRVMHFYCASATKRQKLKRWLQEQVSDYAIILDTKDMNKIRLFSKTISRRVTERLGDLLLISRDGANVVVESPRSRGEPWGILPMTELMASHGSLTADELYTPFIACNASRFQ
jgi:predicted AlkP superfamily pyrophosphatase or phosphodiesterase